MNAPVAVAKVQDVPAGKSIAVSCGGESIAIFNIEGSYYACTNRCPHAGAPLQNGFLSGTVLTCPWHGWRFDLAPKPDAPRDGVTRYRVSVEGDDLLLHFSDAD